MNAVELLPRGSFEQTSIPTLLRLLVKAKSTGLLRCTQSKITKTIYMSEGRLIFATSNDTDDRLGERLLRKGLLTYRALQESVQAMQMGKRQGTLLVESGAIRSKDLVGGITEQVQEIIFSLIPWSLGDYEFKEGDLPSREVIVLRMSTGDLILEGIRRVQSWRRICAGAGELTQCYSLSPESEGLVATLSLQKDELNLIATIDGVSTLEDLCATASLSDFGVCRAVWGLWATGILDRVPQDTALTDDKSDTEPHVERIRGASVRQEIDRFNHLHRFVHDLVIHELREQAPNFFARAFREALNGDRALFNGVAVDDQGELNPIALCRNIVEGEIASYLTGFDGLLEIEVRLVRELLGDRKATIVQNGLSALKQQEWSAQG